MPRLSATCCGVYLAEHETEVGEKDKGKGRDAHSMKRPFGIRGVTSMLRMLGTSNKRDPNIDHQSMGGSAMNDS
jgi:hypothetical protein